MKDLLFISHSSPQENYFAAWLASKLKLLGYRVWVDVRDIEAGDVFRVDIENLIRKETVRFISVVSASYVTKATTKGSGVNDEIELARTIKDIPNFIIPVRLDKTPHNDFPSGILGKDAIDFSNNWADGLNKLVTVLKKTDESGNQTVFCASTDKNPLQFWFEAQKITPGVIQKKELYRTNWFEAKLPEFIYVHSPELLNLSKLRDMPFGFIMEANRVITFASDSTVELYDRIASTEKFKTAEFIEAKELVVDSNFTLKEPRKKLIKLLNHIFRQHLISQGLSIYKQANEREAFHLPYSEENLKRVSLKTYGKSGRSLIGQKAEFRWHYAVNHQAFVHPLPCFRIFYTIVFTDMQGKYLKKDEQHELRRSLPSDWYNRKWLEMLLAMMHKISGFNEDKKINIDVDRTLIMPIEVLPVTFVSEVGYNEPVKEKETSKEDAQETITEKEGENV